MRGLFDAVPQAGHRRRSRDRPSRRRDVRPSIVGGPEGDVSSGPVMACAKLLADVDAAWADCPDRGRRVPRSRRHGADPRCVSFARGEGSGIAVEAATGWVVFVVRDGQGSPMRELYQQGTKPSKPWGCGSRRLLADAPGRAVLPPAASGTLTLVELGDGALVGFIFFRGSGASGKERRPALRHSVRRIASVLDPE